MVLKDDKGEIITLLHNDIIKLIPHRYPLLLIDKVTDIIFNESVTGIKSVTFNEPFFPGHFPKRPVMPGVLILESMAQTAACLVSYQDESLSSNNLVPLPIICLNSIILLTGLINTMFRILSASTPVLNF